MTSLFTRYFGFQSQGAALSANRLDNANVSTFYSKQLISAPTASPLVPEPLQASRVAVAEGLPSSAAAGGPTNVGNGGAGAGSGMSSEEADLQRRLDALRRD